MLVFSLSSIAAVFLGCGLDMVEGRGAVASMVGGSVGGF